MALQWRITANITLLFIWFWFYRPVYSYLRVIFTREEFRSNQVVLLAVIFLIYLQVRKGDLRPRFNELPQLYFPALGLVLIGSTLFLVNERFLDINTLSASMFALASYGLLGLWMRPQRWKEGLPAALLLIGALPFGEHMQTIIGYPVRILTAAIVRDGLAVLGVSTRSASIQSWSLRMASRRWTFPAVGSRACGLADCFSSRSHGSIDDRSTFAGS